MLRALQSPQDRRLLTIFYLSCCLFLFSLPFYGFVCLFIVIYYSFISFFAPFVFSLFIIFNLSLLPLLCYLSFLFHLLCFCMLSECWSLGVGVGMEGWWEGVVKVMYVYCFLLLMCTSFWVSSLLYEKYYVNKVLSDILRLEAFIHQVHCKKVTKHNF